MDRWYVKDFRASTMRRLGWNGPSIDRILITSKDSAEIDASSGANCIVARIQFDNRSDELTDDNMADARLIAAAPDLYEALHAVMLEFGPGTMSDDAFRNANAALARARGERER